MGKRKNLIGLKFSRLLVIGDGEPVFFARTNTFRRDRFLCRCDCGVVKEVSAVALYSGNTKSCGCLAREILSERNRNQPKIESPLSHMSWRSMIERCTNPNHHAYHNYLGRGIGVCGEWLSYERFLSDMGERPSLKFSLDRIDNNKGYSKENCRWATNRQQMNNRRNNRRISVHGETMTIAEA